jgi:serine protease AprX
MPLTRSEVISLIYPQMHGGDAADPSSVVRGRRFTQDTPILPDVWVAFGEERSSRIEILLTPHSECGIEELVRWLRARFKTEYGNGEQRARLVYNESHVLVKVTFEELIRVVLPLSEWFHQVFLKPKLDLNVLEELAADPDIQMLLMDPAWNKRNGGTYPEDFLNMARIAGAVGLGRPKTREEPWRDYLSTAVRELNELLHKAPPILAQLPETGTFPLWSVSLNRRASSAVFDSRLSTKADAAVRLFDIKCMGLRWAVIDSGIDATHWAFRARENCAVSEAEFPKSRVVKTYDFTRLRGLLESDLLNEPPTEGPVLRERAAEAGVRNLSEEQLAEITRDIYPRLSSGRLVDWKLLGQLIEIPHQLSDANDKCGYQAPKNEHGTHVAGILAADWRKNADGVIPGEDPPPRELVGMCPDLELYDLRVFDAAGNGDEFAILAALQFVRWMNASKDKMVVHGVNLSFSLPHAVDSFACGSTPVCEECGRLVASGVVVVAAAGNRGYDNPHDGGFGSYRPSSITDPGNAEDVITVGATHRSMHHKYGVSYFSSRGPTGDGRMKPDLVAPGEKITSTTPGNRWVKLDGTSMAAPHVSGAAALLIARHRELAGNPARIKKILCSTATDLGRTREFQGAGMLDVLRALQLV